jgi:hypothetical protein
MSQQVDKSMMSQPVGKSIKDPFIDQTMTMGITTHGQIRQGQLY